VTAGGRQQTEALLALLHQAQIPFVVVGGVAAVAHGSSLFTRVLDVVIPMEPALLDRLIEVLAPHHPRHALRPDLGPIVQDGEALAGFRMLLIDTDLGRLDVIAEVPPAGRHGDLRTVALPLIAGHETRVVALEQLIAIKEQAARPKDLIAARELRALMTARGGDPESP
jgi:hypothetical protein